jgi:hypothetical protein
MKLVAICHYLPERMSPGNLKKHKNEVNQEGEVKTTYVFSAFLTPFPSNFRFAWYQQVGEGGCYDTLAERYGECIRCFTLTLSKDPVSTTTAQCYKTFYGRNLQIL